MQTPQPRNPFLASPFTWPLLPSPPETGSYLQASSLPFFTPEFSIFFTTEPLHSPNLLPHLPTPIGDDAAAPADSATMKVLPLRADHEPSGQLTLQPVQVQTVTGHLFQVPLFSLSSPAVRTVSPSFRLHTGQSRLHSRPTSATKTRPFRLSPIMPLEQHPTQRKQGQDASEEVGAALDIESGSLLVKLFAFPISRYFADKVILFDSYYSAWSTR
jgi:hypothetical protein